MIWLFYVVLGVLLFGVTIAGAAGGEGVSWFQVGLGIVLIGMGILRRIRRGSA